MDGAQNKGELQVPEKEIFLGQAQEHSTAERVRHPRKDLNKARQRPVLLCNAFPTPTHMGTDHTQTWISLAAARYTLPSVRV